MRRLGEDLNPYKAYGPYGIWPCVLKECDETLDGPLDVFSKSIDEGPVQRGWKSVNVVPVFKNGDRGFV